MGMSELQSNLSKAETRIKELELSLQQSDQESRRKVYVFVNSFNVKCSYVFSDQ